MKINIPKFLQGGGTGLLFSAVANPASNAAQTPTEAASGNGSSDNGIIPKETLNKLRTGNGMANEVDQFEMELALLEDKIAKGLPVSAAEIANMRAKVNRIIVQKGNLDKAMERANTNGALDDVAIDQKGYLYALNQNGKLEKIQFSKFNASKYQALTYSELAEYRRNSPELINNADIILNINGSIGIEKINQFIQDVFSKVGEAETKQEAYSTLKNILGVDPKNISNEQLAAIKAVANAADQIGLDAIFKTSAYNKHNNVGLAAQYIMSIMPKNMRMQLQGTYIAQGGNPSDSLEYYKSVIGMAASTAAKSSLQTGISYEGSINTASTGKKESQRNITPLESLLNGSLGKVDVPIRDSKDSTNLVFHGNGIGSIPDLSGRPIPKTIASIVMDNVLNTFVDENHITMGNQKITRADLLSILYSGQDVANIWAPVDNNGDIDVNGLVIFNQLMDEFKKHPEYSAQEKTAILNQEYGIQGYIDESGEFHGSGNMQKFLMFTGITSDKVLDYDNGRLMDKLVGKTEKDEKAEIERIYASINSGIKDGDAQYEFKEGFFGTNIIKAPVFMKIKNTAYNDASLFTKNGPTVTDPTYASAVTRDNMRYNAEQNGPVIMPSTGYVFQ